MTNKTGHFGFAQAAARTDVGKKRKNNEDAFGVFHEAGVFCVADGMGGGDDGEIASAAVVKGLEDGLKALAFREDGGYAVADVADVVESSLTKASGWIFNRTHAKHLSGCGSTFVGFALDATAPGTALAIHAGDSRLYLLHGRSIKQITHDHSVAEMIGAKDESKVNPMFRSMVMNAIGIRAKADPERTPFKVAKGDRILVCSDGLSRMVTDKKILAVSRKQKDVSVAAEALIAAALDAGGIDNVTVVLVEIGELPTAVPALEPPAQENGEAASDTSDRATGVTGGDSTNGDVQTLVTMMPTMSGEDMLVPEESGEVPVAEEEPAVAESQVSAPEADVAGWRKPLLALGRRRALLVAAGVLGVVLLALLVIGVSRKDADEEVRESAPARAPAPAAVSEPVARPAVTTEAVRAEPPKALPVESAPEAPPVPSVVTSAPPVVTPVPPAATSVPPAVAPMPSAEPLSRPDVPKAAVAPSPAAVPKAAEKVEVSGLEAVLQACEGESLAVFCQSFRRLEGAANRDLDEQMKRFDASARFCARMRTQGSAERAVVDLKYCLETSKGVRNAIKATDKAVARRLLVWWDALLDGEPSDRNSMLAAARFMTGLPEVANR